MMRACLWLLAGAYAPQLSSFASLSGRLTVAGVVLFALLAARSMHALMAFTLGVVLYVTAVQLVIAGRLDSRYAGDSMLGRVRIVDFPQSNGTTTDFVAAPVGDRRIPDRIRLSWFEPPVTLRSGDVWQLEMRLRRPRGTSNPGGFDYEAWLTRERIGATGYVVAGFRNHLLRSGELGAIDAVRQRVVDRLVALLPADRGAGVLAAISVGARHLISSEQWQRYARSGTSHLMAISGLHVGLAASTAYLVASVLLGMVVRHRNVHDAATAAALLVAILYALLSGMAVPAQRATLMIGLGAAVMRRRRQPGAVAIVGFACVVVVSLDPLATMAPGFQLSFAAVLVLIWVARSGIAAPATRAGNRRLLPLRILRQLTKLQLALFFGLLPLAVLTFQRIAFVAPLVNVLAVPLFSFLTVPLVLAGLVLDGPLQSVGDTALLGAAWSVRLLETLLARVALAPAASVEIAAIEGKAWLYLGLVLIHVVMPKGWPGRPVAWLAVLALLLQRPPGPPPGCADIDVLDVGQGLAVIVRTHQGTVVYDTGPAFRDGGSAAVTTILPYLRDRGIKRIDRLIISHADLDHAGGTAAILAALPVGLLLGGEPPADPARPGRRCSAGQHWIQDGIGFRVVHPPGGSRLTGNNASCVVLVEAGSHRAVLAGDIERSVEEDLIARHALGPADIVVVPHHGSGTSSSTGFVTALSPAIAVVAAGHDNRWGFPKPDVSSRWESAGAEVLTTAASGAVSVRLCAEGGIVAQSRHRDAGRRIWHDRDG